MSPERDSSMFYPSKKRHAGKLQLMHSVLLHKTVHMTNWKIVIFASCYEKVIFINI